MTTSFEPQAEPVPALEQRSARHDAARAIAPAGLLLAGAFVLSYYQSAIVRGFVEEVSVGLASAAFWKAAGVGLCAQVVDGALGMAYGVTSTSFLLSVGVPPAAASASVHLAEIFTTGFSGVSHWRLGNVNGALFKRLVIPGIIGSVLGAFVVTSLDGKLLRPYISGYLLLMGIYIQVKAFRTITIATEPPKYIAPLGLTGGFVDAVGGGGWGPVVTTSLISTGQEPRRTIGSVNAAEFFVAVASGVSFAVLGGFTVWTTIAGLVFGGFFAAPLAALLVRRASTQPLMTIVGLLISSLSLHNLWQALR